MRENTNPLATAPIGQLMLKFSIPCIMALLVSSLYNIVDQIFIGQGVGYLGNGATNVVFPITVIALAVALMIGDGCAAYLSICQGRQDEKTASKSVGNAITLFVLTSVVLTVLFALGREGILTTFGATENNVAYAREYFNVIIIGIPFYIFTNGMNSIIRADGSPQYAMISTLVGAIINLILDPIAIFVLGWGVFGAGLATIIGQIVSAVLGFVYLFRSKTFKLNRDALVINGVILGKILPIGVSSFLTQLSIVVTMGVMNNTLVSWGAVSAYGEDIPMTVMGIVMKVFQIVIAFIVGLAAGCQPIIGYNLGAGNYGRVKALYKRMMVCEVAIGAVATAAFELFPIQIISLFGSESGLYNQFAGYAFRIFLATMILCAVQKSTSIFLQASGKPVQAMMLSLLRDFVLMVPLIIFLPNVANLGVMGPLYAGPVADVISFAASMILVVSVFRKLPADNKVLIEKTESFSAENVESAY